MKQAYLLNSIITIIFSVMFGIIFHDGSYFFGFLIGCLTMATYLDGVSVIDDYYKNK